MDGSRTVGTEMEMMWMETPISLGILGSRLYFNISIECSFNHQFLISSCVRRGH